MLSEHLLSYKICEVLFKIKYELVFSSFKAGVSKSSPPNRQKTLPLRTVGSQVRVAEYGPQGLGLATPLHLDVVYGIKTKMLILLKHIPLKRYLCNLNCVFYNLNVFMLNKTWTMHPNIELTANK